MANYLILRWLQNGIGSAQGQPVVPEYVEALVESMSAARQRLFATLPADAENETGLPPVRVVNLLAADYAKAVAQCCAMVAAASARTHRQRCRARSRS